MINWKKLQRIAATLMRDIITKSIVVENRVTLINIEQKQYEKSTYTSINEKYSPLGIGRTGKIVFSVPHVYLSSGDTHSG